MSLTYPNPPVHPARTNAAIALELIEKINGAVDLLIPDYEMPRLNGAALVRAVRSKYASVPVIYMSGYVSAADGLGLDDPARCCAFIAKPFFPKAFVQLATDMVASNTRDATAKSD
jgi:CheY-like chemotaxis protein